MTIRALGLVGRSIFWKWKLRAEQVTPARRHISESVEASKYAKRAD